MHVVSHVHATVNAPGQQSAHTMPAQELLKTALTHYHPDKQQGEDRKWRLLSAEICKRLSSAYQGLK